MGWLKRWRTTRGYGVHSTFAYNLITKVIGQTSAHYYAYAERSEEHTSELQSQR